MSNDSNIPDLTEMTAILLREGFLQESDRDNPERIHQRWALRAKQNQVTVRDLKART